jgi:hypothetical protein
LEEKLFAKSGDQKDTLGFSSFRNSNPSPNPPVERLLPPRFLRAEKVAKPDEGGLAD